VLLRRRKPPAPLGDFIHALYVFEGSAQPHAKERALPDGCAQLIFNLREDRTWVYDRNNLDSCRTFNGALIVGPQSEYCVIDPADLTSIAGIHFKPGGPSALLPVPIHELHNAHVPLDSLWGRFAGEVRERLLAVETPEQRLDVLESTLLVQALLFERRSRGLKRHPAVSFAIDRFVHGECSAGSRLDAVAEVVGQTGFSSKHFIDIFRREVGLTPKLFCRVRRFQRVLESIAGGREIEWTEVALEAGYFDQAHFIHDFRAFSGINPSTYVQARPKYPGHVPISRAR